MSENIEMVKTVAHHLGALRDEVVFLGGAVLSLLVSDVAAGEARPTKDVDLIVDTVYRAAIEHAQSRRVGRYRIKVVSGPYFLTTKLEAFRGRGLRDYRASHDLEDVIALVDGRPELADECQSAAPDLREGLAEQASALLTEPEFLDALPGHLRGDAASQDRDRIVLARLEAIAQLSTRGGTP